MCHSHPAPSATESLIVPVFPRCHVAGEMALPVLSGLDHEWGTVEHAIKTVESDRARFQTMFWLINHIKWMEPPSQKAWKQTADRLSKLTAETLTEQAALVYGRRFNKSGLRGWQDLIIACVALASGVR